MRKPRTNPNVDPVVKCINGHCSAAGSVPFGERMFADDPRVRAAPGYFVADEIDGRPLVALIESPGEG
jgi:hypothetical protein